MTDEQQGHFGPFGGQYVSETLIPALEELDAAWRAARTDPAFQRELDALLYEYVGRPSRLGLARALTRELGVNLAATPSKVVYRNDLMEVLQYAPQTGKVRAVPLLCSPPWINKYYVMDLSPGRSFIEWAVKHHGTRCNRCV